MLIFPIRRLIILYMMFVCYTASLVAQMVKNPPVVQNPGKPGFDSWFGKIPLEKAGLACFLCLRTGPLENPEEWAE